MVVFMFSIFFCGFAFYLKREMVNHAIIDILSFKRVDIAVLDLHFLHTQAFNIQISKEAVE